MENMKKHTEHAIGLLLTQYSDHKGAGLSRVDIYPVESHVGDGQVRRTFKVRIDSGEGFMPKIELTAFDMARRFVGIKETPGTMSNPLILAMLQLDDKWPEDDAVPWCSAFVNAVCWLLWLDRSKSLRARSWLGVGDAVDLTNAVQGFDVVVLKRGGGDQPGPEVVDAPGHVGFYAGHDGEHVRVLGGNQDDGVNVSAYARDRVLGVRRLRG